MDWGLAKVLPAGGTADAAAREGRGPDDTVLTVRNGFAADASRAGVCFQNSRLHGS